MSMTYRSIFIPEDLEERHNLVHHRVHTFVTKLNFKTNHNIYYKIDLNNMTNITIVKIFNTILTDNLIHKVIRQADE